LLLHVQGRNRCAARARTSAMTSSAKASVRSGTVGASLLVSAALALTAVQVADATPPPTPYTGEAAELTTSSATLKGSVYPDNQQTSYYFQYGTTSAYGSQTPTTPAGAGSQTVHVVAPVTGLSVDTTYHYRLVAVNTTSTSVGGDRAFTTKKIPLTFKLVAAPSEGPFESPFTVDGTLSGTGSADHAVVLEANPFPYIAGFETVSNSELTSSDGSFSFSVPGLTQNTELRVATLETPPAVSPTVLERVAVRVTLHLRPTGRHGYVRLYGMVTPAESVALIDFQFLAPGGRPVTVSKAVITDATRTFSRFSSIVRIRRAGLYRAYVRVASGAQISSHSRAILIG
jgi:hypothetical protein